jgi:copper resistance protein C
MRAFGFAALAALSLAAGPAGAHTVVKSVSIAEGAKLKAAPPSITVTMGRPVGVGGVTLTNSAGRDVPLAYKPSRAMAAAFSVPLPLLAPDSYRLNWRVIAEDGHVMTGKVAFTVTGAR